LIPLLAIPSLEAAVVSGFSVAVTIIGLLAVEDWLLLLDFIPIPLPIQF